MPQAPEDGPHSWCMGVVSHCYGGLGGGRDVCACLRCAAHDFSATIVINFR